MPGVLCQAVGKLDLRVWAIIESGVNQAPNLHFKFTLILIVINKHTISSPDPSVVTDSSALFMEKRDLLIVEGPGTSS